MTSRPAGVRGDQLVQGVRLPDRGRLLLQPRAGEAAFGLTRRDLRAAGRSLSRGRGTPAMDRYLSLVGLPTGGAVRVSLGVASTIDDVDAFLDFAERTYRDRRPDLARLPPRHSC